MFESVFSCADCTHKAFVCAHCAQRAFLAEYVGLVCDNIHIAEYVGSFAEFIELFCDAQGSFAKYVQGLFCGIHCGICRLFGGTFWVFGGTLRAFFRKIKRCCAARHSRRTEKQRGADASRS